MDPALIPLSGQDLTSLAIVEAAHRRRKTELTDEAAVRIRSAHEFASYISALRPVYGRSTGVGANRNIGVSDPGEHALALLRSHATSGGPVRSDKRVRAMLVVRLNQLAAGGSGVGVGVAIGLAAMIAADALPVVRELGGIGTSDLSALATTALTLMAELPTVAGEVLPRTEFGAQDAMAFLSSNAGVIGDAALVWSDLEVLSRAYPVVAALTFAAVDANAEAYSMVVERATPFAGSVRVMRWLRQLTADASAPARIQDPFGLRALPQAHGPLVDALASLDSVVTAMANAPSENPVLLPDPESKTLSGQLAHHGGFHSVYLGQALDSTTIALAQSAQLVQARLATLAEPAFTGRPPFLGDGTAGASGIMSLEYISAGALAQIRSAATPAALQSVVISRGIEEDASFASLAARQAAGVVSSVRTMLSCELVAAVRAIRLRGLELSGLSGQAFQLCDGLSDQMQDRDLTPDILLAQTLLPSLAALIS